MRNFVLAPLLLVGAAIWAPAFAVTAGTAPMSDDQLIASAVSAAPAAVAKDAGVMTMDADMKVKTLRKSKNGFICMPDVPETPGPDPMCVDKGGMAWLDAWAMHKDPPKGVIGFGYMLLGGSDPDNMDPYAAKPPAGMQWVTTGPHIMIFNAPDMIKDYPTAKQPDTSKPYVMYAGTAYAHLMIAVQ